MSRKSDLDNRANQLNPQHDAYHSSRREASEDDERAAHPRQLADLIDPDCFGPAPQRAASRLAVDRDEVLLHVKAAVDYRPFTDDMVKALGGGTSKG
jgi:hypothetical protein